VKPLAVIALIVVCAVAGTHTQSRTATEKPRRLALVGGMLVSGYDLVPPLHHAAVIIEGNRITWVGPAADAKIPPDAEVIDTSGRTMMPGLMDLHVHLMLLGHGNYPRWFPWSVEYGVGRVMEISARQLLMAGVTTAVDLSGPLEASLAVRDRINRGELKGPRMLMSGPWVSLSQGRFPPEQVVVSTPDEAYAATETLARAGVDVIKAYPMSAAHYAKVVEAAHKHGLKVYAHAVDEQLVKAALAGGVDVITHPGGGDGPPYDPSFVHELVTSKRPVTATAIHRFVYSQTIAFPGRLRDQRLKADFPDDLWREVQDSFANWQTLSYFQAAGRDALFGKPRLKQLVEAGVVMGMGTDSGTPMNFHTEALWREVEAHVEAGMTPLRAISAATRTNAQIIGRGADLGTIEPGKLADIIVVKGDPLSHISALSEVETVVKDGVVEKRP
jgi:imidazolonepropionase-like amidohydrolase